jgi:hypothetical protein
MPIPLECGQCGRAMKVKDELAGKRVKCPGCQAVLTVPRPGPDAEDAAFELLSQSEAEEEPPGPAPRAADPGPPPPPPPRPAAKPTPPPPARKPLPIRFREREERPRGPSIVVSPAVAGGALAMVAAVAWFGLGYMAGRTYIYPPIMFVFGLVAVVKGLLGHPED